MLQISLEWKFPAPIVPKQQLNYSLIIDGWELVPITIMKTWENVIDHVYSF